MVAASQKKIKTKVFMYSGVSFDTSHNNAKNFTVFFALVYKKCLLLPAICCRYEAKEKYINWTHPYFNDVHYHFCINSNIFIFYICYATHDIKFGRDYSCILLPSICIHSHIYHSRCLFFYLVLECQSIYITWFKDDHCNIELGLLANCWNKWNHFEFERRVAHVVAVVYIVDC